MLLPLVQSIISSETLMPIGIVASVLLPLTGWLVWLNGRLMRIDAKLARIEALHAETWSFNQMEAWALRLKNRNPTLSIPDPEPPARGPRQVYGEA